MALPRRRRPPAPRAPGRRRGASCGTRGSTADYLPARLKLAESLLDAGNLEDSRRLFSRVDRTRTRRPRRSFGLGRIAALEGRQHEPSNISSGRSRSFPSSAPRTTPSRSRTARSAGGRGAGRARAACAVRRALAGDRRSGSGGRDHAARRRRRAPAARRNAAEAGDVDGAIAAHEAALALDPSLAQAHANLISLYGRARNFAKAEEHYRAVVTPRRQRRRCPLRLRRAAGLQEQWDWRPRRLPRARDESAARAGAQQPRADSRARSDSSRRRPRSTGAPSTASRPCAWPGSTWDACSSPRGAPTTRSPSSRS